jgi:hypothetical protein
MALGTVNQINEFIEIKVSLSRSSIPEQRARALLFPLSGICAGERWTWTNLSWSCVRIKEWVKEKERQGQGKSKRVPRLCLRAHLHRAFRHLHYSRVHARNKNEHGTARSVLHGVQLS